MEEETNMLTVEERTRCFKYLSKEWINYKEDGMHYIPESEECSIYVIDIEDGVLTGGVAHYELFLQKVIEGINKDDRLMIVTSTQFIEVYAEDYEIMIQVNIPDYENINEAKETAIRYVVKESKSNESNKS